MQRTPLVSICMPAYNHAGYVGLTIESILEQTHTDFELIISDDCSDDLCFDVICSYDDPRIDAMRLPRRSGVSLALNASLQRARGKYVAFCSSDDLWLPQKLERQLAFLEAHAEVGALFCRPWLIDAKGARIDDASHPVGRVFAKERGGRWLETFFFDGNCLCAVTPLLRGEAVSATGPFNPTLLQLQDLEYWIRLAAGYQIHMSDERLVEYRVPEGASHLSAHTPDRFARTLYETYRVLGLYARGAPASAVAAVTFADAPPFDWRPSAPSEELLLANAALRVGLPSHLLFALDRLYDYGRGEASRAGAADEARLFHQALFELTGSPRMQALLLAGMESSPLEPTPAQQRREIDQLEAEIAALRRQAGARAHGVGARLLRAFGRGPRAR